MFKACAMASHHACRPFLLTSLVPRLVSIMHDFKLRRKLSAPHMTREARDRNIADHEYPYCAMNAIRFSLSIMNIIIYTLLILLLELNRACRNSRPCLNTRESTPSSTEEKGEDETIGIVTFGICR